MGSSCPNYASFKVKKTENLLKRDARFKRKLTQGLKNDRSNLVNVHGNSRKSENLRFDGFILSKAYKVSDKKIQKSYVDGELEK